MPLLLTAQQEGSANYRPALRYLRTEGTTKGDLRASNDILLIDVRGCVFWQRIATGYLAYLLTGKVGMRLLPRRSLRPLSVPVLVLVLVAAVAYSDLPEDSLLAH